MYMSIFQQSRPVDGEGLGVFGMEFDTISIVEKRLYKHWKLQYVSNS